MNKAYTTREVIEEIEKLKGKKFTYSRIAAYAKKNNVPMVNKRYVFNVEHVNDIISTIGKKGRNSADYFSVAQVVNIVSSYRTKVVNFAKDNNVKKMGREYRFSNKDVENLKTYLKTNSRKTRCDSIEDPEKVEKMFAEIKARRQKEKSERLMRMAI